jgi:hypothetical protein
MTFRSETPGGALRSRAKESAQGFDYVFLIIIGRQDKDSGRRRKVNDPMGHGQSAHPRHFEIHNQHLRAQFGGERQRPFAGRGFADNLAAVFLEE